MNIVVCVKHVPDTEVPIKIRADGRGVEESGLNHVLNFYDEHGVEEALRIKERFGGTVTLVTAGPSRAVEALRTGLAMGADAAIHIQDPALSSLDHVGTARVLAAAIKPLSADLVLCGKLSTDDNAAVVGPAVAEFLDLPQATAITKLELGEGAATAHREVEGAVEVLEVKLPAVITVERGINEPRYPSLPGIMRARRTAVAARTLADLGIAVPPAGHVELLNMTPPPKRQAGRRLEGEAAVIVQDLVRALREEAKVL
ncbi:MAG TPA: electron transfer flavoprotein subunit beta/FixA family protein [bacterium]|nr:electron transfer flavoprotein subunit beta/FixA family protein [bacterium]